MRKVNVNRVALVSQAIFGICGLTQPRIVQTTVLMSRISLNSNPLWLTLRPGNHFGLPKNFLPYDVPGTMCFSTNAAMCKAKVEERKCCNDLPKVELYQYADCPDCMKIRVFLDYCNIPYEFIEINPITEKEIEWSECKIVPMVVVDGEQMVYESSDIIIDKLFQWIMRADNTVLDDEEEKKWRGWVDNHLVHILFVNMYRTPWEALESSGYITRYFHFSKTVRRVVKYAGGASAYFESKKQKKEHNITDERAALYEAAETWAAALQDQPFHGRLYPNFADLCVFGALKTMRHLKSGKDMVENNTPIGEWYARMEYAVGEGTGLMRLKLSIPLYVRIRMSGLFDDDWWRRAHGGSK